MFQVTTDPVKLWSSKTSVARQQKDYFDQHFRPFYRTTQLIIIPDDQSFMTRDDYLSPPAPFSVITVGPAFEIGFLTRVLQLQTEVLQIQGTAPSTGQNVTLTDICFKPLSPDNNNCTVLSLLQYYQNSLQNLNARQGDEFFTSFDYLTHFFTCAQAPSTAKDNPLGLSCFADFGGTISPFMVLGNYSNDIYSNATALVITIVIENSNDDQKIELGMKIILNYCWHRLNNLLFSCSGSLGEIVFRFHEEFR